MAQDAAAVMLECFVLVAKGASALLTAGLMLMCPHHNPKPNPSSKLDPNPNLNPAPNSYSVNYLYPELNFIPSP